MLSVVIPSRNEKFLGPTVADILKKASHELEIIVIGDGYMPAKGELPDDERVRVIHFPEAHGMRHGINAGIRASRGDRVMKIDAHCMVSEGFDHQLFMSCEDTDVVIPRRKRLDADKWEIENVGKPDVDYEYLSFPERVNDFGGPGLNGKIWTDRILARLDIPYDENLSFQGSAWYMHRSYFDYLELMDEASYGPFWNEAQEIGLKAWLSGGRVMTEKRAWYAHLHKGKKHGRGYSMQNSWLVKGATFTKTWMGPVGTAWHKQQKPLSWLIEKFMPMPTWDQEKLETLRKMESSICCSRF